MPMPGLKSLKGIGRRKSGTPEPVSNPTPAPSGFRVLPREEVLRKSLGGLDRPPVPLDHRRTWSEEESSSNRGSGSSAATSNSRVSDRPLPERPMPPPPPSHAAPLVPPPDRYKRLSALLPHPDRPAPAAPHEAQANRSASSGSQGYLDLPTEQAEGSFGDMFKGLGLRKSMTFDDAKISTPAAVKMDSQPSLTPADASWRKQAKTPPPALQRVMDADASPYSAKTPSSQDRLLSSPSSEESSFRIRRKQPSSTDHRASTLTMDSSDLLPPNILRRTESNESFARTGAGEDVDAKLVRNSFIATQGLNYRQTHGNGSPVKETANGLLKPQPDSHTSSETSTKTQSLSSASSTSPTEPIPVAPKISPGVSPRVGALDTKETRPPASQLAVKPTSNNRLSSLPTPPARLSMHSSTEELNRLSIYDGKTSNRSSVSTDDEKLGADARAKAKKEAEEVIARQRMSKDVDNDYFSLNRASQSAPNLPKLLAPVSESGSSDDDDDIPLGILQAQNFPNRSKTPDARLSSMPGPSRPSAIGPGTLAPRPSLPPFARKLPDDPYGVSGDMMNGSRDSLLLNRQSMYPPPGVSPVPGIPPGGLVGVIAEEERVKSMRRAPENRQSTLPPMGPAPMNPAMSMGMGMPMNIPGVGMGLGAGMPAMPAMPAMPVMPSPELANQNQINAQLLQVIQQQTVMLQHMFTQMHGSQASVLGTPEMPSNGFGPAPGSPSLRPQHPGMPPRTMSMVNPPMPPNAAARTMSMVNTSAPFAHPWTTEPVMSGASSVRGLGVGYAQSVAPSERSNVGQPSRYRPVSSVYLDGPSPPPLVAQATTARSNTLPIMEMRDTDSVKGKKKSGFFSTMLHSKGSRATLEAPKQAEDEEDWSSFARKRRSVLPPGLR